jgi:catechol 2,3-dioxygenase-like lactoylglutathione lyase family enzyme
VSETFSHVGFEVSDIARSAAFYDAVLGRLGLRRLHDGDGIIGYGTTEPRLFIVQRGRPPAPGYGHTALRASGRAAVDAAYAAALESGGTDDGPPGLRPQYGPRYYAAYVLDPDGLRLELVAGGH